MNWKGGERILDGYVMILSSGHPFPVTGGYVKRCRLIAEKAVGHILARSIAIHHVNENRVDDRNENLVICENRGYHTFLHWRLRALRISGHVNYRKCQYCGRYDDPQNMIPSGKKSMVHSKCRYNYHKSLKERRKSYE